MRPYQLALMLSTALFATAAAHAGEVTLFSGNDLTGRESTVRGNMNNLQSVGFNDRAMSLVVHSGRWEICTDTEFRGECRVFDAGPYRSLDRFTNKISSLREIAGERRDDGRDDGRDGGRGRGRHRGGEQSVMLFDSPDLRGRSVSLRSDANNFVPLGFNDATQSMVIRGGTWEFCQHTDFRGQCRVFGPGEYRNLDRAFNRAISSARQVGDGGDRRSSGYSQRDSNGNTYSDRDGGAVELFSEQGFRGQRLPVNNEMRSLTDVDFNDRAGSMVIQSGQWEICQDSEFRGQCQVFGPGRYERLGMLHNAISSIRRVR